MKKEIQIPLYPRRMWLIDSAEDLEGFTFVIGGGNNTECRDSKDFLAQSIAEGGYGLITHAVIENETGNLGVIVYVDTEFNDGAGAFAHEAVHVADYVFDELNMTSQSYEDGNEPYAYLVGWITNEIEKYYDDRRKQSDVEA